MAGALVFGDKWALKHGEGPQGEWGSVLMKFDRDQILIGIERMKDEAEDKIANRQDAWPPTVFEFACFCKTQNNKTSSLYFPDGQKSLPPPRPSKEFASKKIAEIRKKLRRN